MVRLVLVLSILVGLVFAGISVYGVGTFTDTGDQRYADPRDNIVEERKETNKEEYEDTGPTKDLRVKDESKEDSRYLSGKEPSDGWFKDVTSKSGLGYPDNVTKLRRLLEGEFGVGVYVSDFNSDGWMDVLFISQEQPVLFKNTDGSFEQSDRLPAVEENVTAAHFFDYDNDGWDDLYLLSDEESVFFENEGGEFVEKDVGLDIGYESVRGAATADYTGNGCLDVFVIQANDWTEHRPEGYNDRNVTIEGDNGNRNRLFRGNCESFTETTAEAGIEGTAWSLATSFVDLTNDGYPDIHVANDFNNDVVYINNGNGTFERRVLPDYTNRNGMSSEVADVNGDGYLDIFVSNIHHSTNASGYGGISGVSEGRYGGRVEGNNLLINSGNGRFSRGGDEYGVSKGGWGWAALAEDFDNNRHLDLYQTTEIAGIFWKNNGTYRRVNSSVSGIGSVSTKGAVAFDYDRSGSLDILEAVDPFAPNWNVSPVRLNKNNLSTGNWLQIDVSGDGTEGTVMGTKVYVKDEDGEQMRVLRSNSDYMSQSSRVLHFGLGNLEEVDRIRVEWPRGRVSKYTDVSVNTRYTVSVKHGLSETTP